MTLATVYERKKCMSRHVIQPSLCTHITISWENTSTGPGSIVESNMSCRQQRAATSNHFRPSWIKPIEFWKAPGTSGNNPIKGLEKTCIRMDYPSTLGDEWNPHIFKAPGQKANHLVLLSWKTNLAHSEPENDDVKEISRRIHKEYIRFQGFILPSWFSGLSWLNHSIPQ